MVPAGAPNAVTLSVTQNDDSALWSPGPVSFSGSTITINYSSWFTPGTYVVKVGATISGATTQPTPITFNVVIKCTA